MATDNARQFLSDLCNDSSLRAQYNTMGASSTDAILDFALAKGYSFSETDLREALSDYPEQYVLDQMRDKLHIPKKPVAARTS